MHDGRLFTLDAVFDHYTTGSAYTQPGSIVPGKRPTGLAISAAEAEADRL